MNAFYYSKCSGGAIYMRLFIQNAQDYVCMYFSIQNAKEEPDVCIFSFQNVHEEPYECICQFKMHMRNHMFSFPQESIAGRISA